MVSAVDSEPQAESAAEQGNIITPGGLPLRSVGMITADLLDVCYLSDAAQAELNIATYTTDFSRLCPLVPGVRSLRAPRGVVILSHYIRSVETGADEVWTFAREVGFEDMKWRKAVSVILSAEGIFFAHAHKDRYGSSDGDETPSSPASPLNNPLTINEIGEVHKTIRRALSARQAWFANGRIIK